MVEFLFSGRESFPAEYLLGRLGPQLRIADQLIGRGREDAPRIAELFQQVHGAFQADARRHLKGNILDGHTAKRNRF